MSDFIIQIGEMASPELVAKTLQSRPGMQNRMAKIYRFSWGSAVIQLPPGRGYAPLEQGMQVFACTGRPRLIGIAHEDAGEDGFCRAAWRIFENDSIDAMLESLTGMFALALIGDDGFRVVTDLLGSQPVYQAVGPTGSTMCIGTNADIVANVSGHSSEIDLVSVGEFLVFDQITFPFTSYKCLTELEPASLNEWRIGSQEIHSSSRVYWQPREPKTWASRAENARNLESALRTAAEEVSRGSARIAITLSGGRDSRTVLSLLRDRGIAAALTFCTRENRETAVARQVADAANVPHVLVRRDPHFYGKLLERTMSLIGSEVRGVAHGYAIVDAGLTDRFDVIVGGYLSDTLLKDHFMPLEQLNRLRKKSIRERMLAFVRPRKPQKAAGTRWAASPEILCPVIRDQVLARRRARRAKIAEIRPESAEEWQGFWPVSRQHDVGSAWANNRLLSSDELFYFRNVIEVAVRLSPSDRYAGSVAHETFNRLCGPLNAVMNANTGVAASADDTEEGRFFKKLRRSGRLNEFRNLDPSETPWNDVQHSWADPVKLLQYSPDWHRYRDTVLRSNAQDILGSVLSVAAQAMLSRFEATDDPRVSMALLQMGLHIKYNA